MGDLRRRKGFILIDREALWGNNPNTVSLSEQGIKELFANFYPVSGELAYDYGFGDYIRYYGFSPYFEVMNGKGELIPEYSVTIKQEIGELVTVSFEKVK